MEHNLCAKPARKNMVKTGKKPTEIKMSDTAKTITPKTNISGENVITRKNMECQFNKLKI
jgi:hypothetical protein